MVVPPPQYQGGRARLENLHMINMRGVLIATLVLRLGLPRLPTLMALQTLGENPTTVATQMGSLDHGKSGIRKLLWANHKSALSNKF